MRISHAVLVANFDKLTDKQKHAYSVLADRDLICSRTLWDELKTSLLNTKGKVPYFIMATHLGNIVCAETIHNFLRNQDSYHMRVDRILLHLDQSAKERRVIWGESFWIFWKSASMCPTTEIQFVSVHMDKKWFHAIQTRRNNKVLTSIGVDGADYYAHHKNYVGKCMYVVVTAFVPNDNDFAKGSIIVPVACVRVGKMVKAKKDSFERVYALDGTWTNPQIPENKLQSKGDMYFKSFELTGSNEGTKNKPKMSLLKIYQDTIIPALEEKVVNQFSNTMEKLEFVL